MQAELGETYLSCSVENVSRAACANWFAGGMVLKSPGFYRQAPKTPLAHSTLGEVFNSALPSPFLAHRDLVSRGFWDAAEI